MRQLSQLMEEIEYEKFVVINKAAFSEEGYQSLLECAPFIIEQAAKQLMISISKELEDKQQEN